MNFNTLSAILRGLWLIDKEYVNQHLPVIFGILSGKMNGAELMSGSGQNELPYVVNNGKRYEAYKNYYDRDSGTMKTMLLEDMWPANSAGVIPTIGPVMKYNGDCGEPGMIQRTSWANDFANSDKIVKLVSWIDSPGGQADGTPQYADFIKSIDKPKTALVDGGAYSAGAWIAAAHDEIMLANNFAGFGSIGAYCTFVDYSGYYKKMGFKVRDIYSTLSPEKNDAYRKALNGDDSGYEASSDACASQFISAFADFRGDKLKSSAWDKGATYDGKQALDMGLVDSVGSLKDAVAYKGKTLITKPSNNQNQNTDMKFTNVTSLAQLNEISDAQLDLANADLTTENITGVTLVRESFIQEAATISDDLNKVKTELEGERAALTTAKSDLQTATTALEISNSKITELEGKIEAFGKAPGATHRAAAGNDPAPDGPDSTENIMNGLAHNQTADKILGVAK